MEQCQITSNHKEIPTHSFFSVRVIVSRSIFLVVLFIGVLHRRVYIVFLLNARSQMEQCQITSHHKEMSTHLIFSSWFCFSLNLSRFSVHGWATLSSLRIFFFFLRTAWNLMRRSHTTANHKEIPINIPFLDPDFVPHSIFLGFLSMGVLHRRVYEKFLLKD